MAAIKFEIKPADRRDWPLSCPIFLVWEMEYLCFAFFDPSHTRKEVRIHGSFFLIFLACRVATVSAQLRNSRTRIQLRSAGKFAGARRENMSVCPDVQLNWKVLEMS